MELVNNRRCSRPLSGVNEKKGLGFALFGRSGIVSKPPSQETLIGDRVLIGLLAALSAE